jgi:hypothetical protein
VPDSEITFDSAGNLYGVTASGGTSSYGVAYEFTGIASGTPQETILHEFTGGSDGGYPRVR